MDEATALKQMKELERNSAKMRLAAEKWASDFQTLIAIILSARTIDETTIKICTELFKRYPNAESLAKSRIEDVAKIIKPVNFYRNKTQNIIKCAKSIIKFSDGKIPKEIEELISLPGVGRKTANVFLSELGKPGIGVDTHVQYISQKLGWTKNSKPEKIEEDLKKLFSKENWNKVNSTLVRFGKTHRSRKNKDEILENIRRMK